MGIIRKEDVHSSFDDYIKKVMDGPLKDILQETQKLNGYKTSTDLNDEGEVGKVTVTKAVSTTLNTPNLQGLTGALAYAIFTYKNSDVYGIQVALASGSNDIFIRKYSPGGWGLWVKNLVNEDGGWILIPLTEGITNYANCMYRKINNRVTLTGRAKGVSGYSGSIGTLPSGYRPSIACNFPVILNGGKSANITITTTGEINWYSNESLTGDVFIGLDCNFLI